MNASIMGPILIKFRKSMKFDVIQSSETLCNVAYYISDIGLFCHPIVKPSNTKNPKISIFASSSPYVLD
jgi:hypothetical protein